MGQFALRVTPVASLLTIGAGCVEILTSAPS